jgi:hypothetical protein
VSHRRKGCTKSGLALLAPAGKPGVSHVRTTPDRSLVSPCQSQRHKHLRRFHG